MQIICHGLRDEDFQVEFINHEISLGAEDSNGIAVKGEGVAGCHAFLVEEGDGLFIRDNENSGGTILNHKKVQGRQKVSSGDIIEIGSKMIRVDVYPDRKVILNFMSTDPSEDNSVDATVVTMMTVASPVTPPVTSDDDEVGHTMVAPMPADSPATSNDDEVGHTMVAPTMEEPGVTASTIKIFVGGGEIGKYVIVKRIGKGGMGEVYLAKHKTLGTYRALKVLPKELMDDNAKFFERFIREAKLASEIRHPNVVGVMDVETDSADGIPYIVMEYIDGGSLRDSLATNKKLSEEQAVVIVEAIASALRAAEEHKVVHRDIKPDNIMFTKQGEVKLVDLGIAKNDDKENDLTKTNMMIGTPAYLPPEQAQNAKGVDGRADIYSLGATFYEMLTGQHPYPGNNTIEILHKLFSDPVPDPRKVNPEVSPASAAIVMKMLAKNPKDRFQNANELLETMDKAFPPHTPYEAGELIKKVIAGECHNSTNFSSSISSAHFLLWRLKKPNKWVIIAVALFIACCIVGMLFLFLGKGRSDKPVASHDPVTDPAPVTTTTEPEPVRGSLYELQIKTTPDSEIHFITQDGQMRMYSSDHDGMLRIPDLPASSYKIRISRSNYLPISRDFELKDNMTLDVPMTADLKKLVIKAKPDSKISVAGVENGEKTVNASSDGSAVIDDLIGETVLVRIELPGWETYEQTLLLNKDMELQVPQKRIRVDLTVRTAPYAEIVLKQNDEVVQTVKANSMGVAIADDVPAGKYQLAVSGNGYHAKEMECDLNRNQNLSVDLERITYELQIEADAETQIMLYLDHQLQGTYLVPESGILRLASMPQGKYSLSAEKRGKVSQSFELNLDRNQTMDCHLADVTAEVNPAAGQTAEQTPVTDNPPETQVSQQEQPPTPAEEVTEVEQQPPEPEKPVEGTILVYFLASTDVMNYVKENGLAISVGDQSWSDIREFPWSQSITAGKYNISVHCEGIEEMSIPQFTITAGQENECLLELTAKPSYVSFVSNMEDAIITFNNSTCKPGEEVECETFREFTAEGIFGDETISHTVRSSKPGDKLTVEFAFTEKPEEPEESGKEEVVETGTGESGQEETPETGNEQVAETGIGESGAAAAEQSKADAQYAEGMKLFADRKYKDALKVFTSAAEAGHKEAARKVGEINERGLGMWFSDSAEAIKWYRKAAELGDAESAGKVAKAIDEGDTKGSAKEMMDYYLQASVLKQPEVLYRISNLYKTGYKEIPQDNAKAIDYLRQAAELGDPDAMFDLGIRYEKGDGVVSNTQTALQWINKAADAGHDKAQRYRKQLRQ